MYNTKFIFFVFNETIILGKIHDYRDNFRMKVDYSLKLWKRNKMFQRGRSKGANINLQLFILPKYK